MRLHEKEGYRCTRSGASLGEFDYIGISEKDIVLVQVKTNCWPGKKERQAIEAFPAPELCRKLIHRWNDYGRKPQVQQWIDCAWLHHISGS